MKFKVYSVTKGERTHYELWLHKPFLWMRDRYVRAEIGRGDYAYPATFYTEKDVYDYVRNNLVSPDRKLINTGEF